MSDARDALRSTNPRVHHRSRLDAMVRGEWRLLFVVVVILALGGVLDALGLIA